MVHKMVHLQIMTYRKHSIYKAFEDISGISIENNQLSEPLKSTLSIERAQRTNGFQQPPKSSKVRVLAVVF